MNQEARVEEYEARLPRPPGVIRRWLAAHPVFVDFFIVGCYLLGALPLTAFGVVALVDLGGVKAPVIAFDLAYAFLKIGVVVCALAFRRRHAMLGLIAVVLVLIGEGGPLGVANAIALWVMLYSVAVYASVKQGWIAYGIAVAGSLVSSFITPLYAIFAAEGADVRTNVIIDAIVLLTVLLVGINLGNRRRYLAAIIDRANQLARERDQLARLAVAEERSRIAREMHDIVAHSVSVMIALSEGGARAVAAAPEEAAEAMRRSAETGRTALGEMRRLLGALRADEAAELAPQPSVDDVPALVRGFEQAGLAVALHDAGVDRADRMLGLAMYRVVQEGLTNVLRYAGEGARAEVVLRRVPGGTEVVVRDHGRSEARAEPMAGLGSGRGLAGLVERLRVFGGTVESGPIVGEPGWRLRAFFPDARQATAAVQPDSAAIRVTNTRVTNAVVTNADVTNAEEAVA